MKCLPDDTQANLPAGAPPCSGSEPTGAGFLHPYPEQQAHVGLAVKVLTQGRVQLIRMDITVIYSNSIVQHAALQVSQVEQRGQKPFTLQ